MGVCRRVRADAQGDGDGVVAGTGQGCAGGGQGRRPGAEARAQALHERAIPGRLHAHHRCSKFETESGCRQLLCRHLAPQVQMYGLAACGQTGFGEALAAFMQAAVLVVHQLLLCLRSRSGPLSLLHQFPRHTVYVWHSSDYITSVFTTLQEEAYTSNSIPILLNFDFKALILLSALRQARLRGLSRPRR